MHIVRDGRDVVPSILGMSFGPDRFAEAVLFWQRRVEQGLAGGAALGPERYREIRYEALVADPEAVLRDLCPFLGLEYSAEMLRYHERADDLLDGLRATRHVQGSGARPPPACGTGGPSSTLTTCSCSKRSPATSSTGSATSGRACRSRAGCGSRPGRSGSRTGSTAAPSCSAPASPAS